MLSEISEKYKKQYELYSNIYDILKNFDVQNIDTFQYYRELQNIDYILEKIKKLNDGAEQLKQIYVLKNDLDDFVGSEIIKIENSDKYNEFKIIVDSLTNKIVSVKKLQDRIINRMNNEVDIAKQMIKEISYNKKTNPKFSVPNKKQHSVYIDKKK